jgi:UrcA family protein
MFPMLKLMVPAMLLAACLPQTALAQQEPHADIHVAYRDLDLRTPAGLRTLDRRIEGAIAEVCPTPPGDSLLRQLVVERCRKAKRAEAAAGRAAAVAYAGRAGVALATRSAR